MSPDQEKMIKVWREGAKDALDTAEKLYESKKYQHALFFCHLAVEKALKANYISLNNDTPPYSHDLVLLASKSSHDFTKEQLEILAIINTFNIAARYQEEKLELYKKATPTYTRDWIDHASLIIQNIL